jgi:hypothetical protein
MVCSYAQHVVRPGLVQERTADWWNGIETSGRENKERQRRVAAGLLLPFTKT